MQTGLSYSVAELLPHGPSFMLLDALHEYGAEHASCHVDITPQSLFFEAEHGVPGWVGVEYMAQTIGVYAGIVRKQGGLPIEIGLLLGTRRYHCTAAYFAPGAQLTVRAEQLVRDASGVAAFACSIHIAGHELARAEIKAFQPDDIRDYLRGLTESTA